MIARLKRWWRKVTRGWTVEDVAAYAHERVTAVDKVRTHVDYDDNMNGDSSDDCMAFSDRCKAVFSLKGWTGFIVRVQSKNPVKTMTDSRTGTRYDTYYGHRFWCWEDNGCVWFADQVSTNVAGNVDEIVLKCRVGYEVVLKEVIK